MSPLVEELTSPPTVGATYRVRCLAERRWPVFGPSHSDPEIGVPEPHYHIDPRFVPDLRLRALALTEAALGSAQERFVRVAPTALLLPLLFAQVLADTGEPLVVLELPCLRPMPDYPLHFTARWVEELEARFRDACVIAGRCPHKGLPLLSLPLDGGRRTCTGHGLCWTAEGRLAPRPPEERRRMAGLASLAPEAFAAPQRTGKP